MLGALNNVYTKQEIDTNDTIYDNALNNKCDKSNTYLNTEIYIYIYIY